MTKGLGSQCPRASTGTGEKGRRFLVVLHIPWVPALSLPSSSPHTSACRLGQERLKDVVRSGTPLPAALSGFSYLGLQGKWAVAGCVLTEVRPAPSPPQAGACAVEGRLGKQELFPWRQHAEPGPICEKNSHDLRQDNSLCSWKWEIPSACSPLPYSPPVGLSCY